MDLEKVHFLLSFLKFIRQGHFILISNFLPSPISIIFLKVVISRSDLLFSILDIIGSCSTAFLSQILFNIETDREDLNYIIRQRQFQMEHAFFHHCEG